MAILHVISCHVFVAFVSLFIGECTGDTVHMMSVTTTPFGAGIASPLPSIVCLLSHPESSVLLVDIYTGRHVLRGQTYNSLALPFGSAIGYPLGNNALIQSLPSFSLESQGVFYCEASNRGLTTRVPVTILVNNRYLQPSNGLFTITVNIGSTVTLNVDIRSTPTGNPDIRWEKQGNETADFQVLPYKGTEYTINSATEENAGVYYAYWGNLRDYFTGSLIRLIVRSCINNKWGTSCINICDNCYNGGICDDKTGECVCRPGFMGPNCLTACGENKFGWECKHMCGSFIASCSGSIFCMPDPVGCSCMTGWMGTECIQECPVGMYGAGCTQSCNCQSVTCDRFTGRCSDGVCQTGWTGDNCQTTCPLGYYGTECLDKCNCINCDKTTGDCMNSQCYYGYWADQCDQQCDNCYNCDKATGCMNGQCNHGYWGEQCELQCNNCNNCDKATGCIQCYPGYWGEQCELQCNNCFICNKATGCMNVQCHYGYWGEQCEQQCNSQCINCDRITGCMTSECISGYWGEQCDIECHCLNGAACDKDTAKCNGVDFTTGLSLCEPGYESDTGVSPDNCQQDSGCYSSCTKTCHCQSPDQCDPNLGCTQGCRSNWGGTDCQTGIVSMTYEKTNPLQPVYVTVIITGVVPDVNQIILTYSNKDSSTSTGIPNSNQNGQYLTVTYILESYQAGSRIICSFPDPAATQTRSIIGAISSEYYTLPALRQAPSVENIGTTSVTLRWNVWDPDNGDEGDGPVIAYNVYNQMSTKMPVTTVQGPLNPSDTHITATIGLLSPGMLYIFYIRLVRPGQGGVGPSSQGASVTTLSMMPEPGKTTLPADTMRTSEITTKQSLVPGPPTSVTAVLGDKSITLQWNEPVNSNGDINFYHIAYRAAGKASFANFSLDVRENIRTHHEFILQGLQPATVYDVYVSAENTFRKGKSTYLRVETLKGSVSSSSTVTGASVAVVVFIIIIVAIVVVCVMKRRKEHNETNSSNISKQVRNEGSHFENQAFNPDTVGYEDVDLDDQEYEEVTSSQWHIAWEDLNLSGQILGKGNFGDVQMAKVKIKEKWIMAAVKTLKDGTPESERMLFKEEFDTMTRIGHHPNVVNILGSCEYAGSFYVVLEYVHHGNLRKFLRKCRKESKEADKRGQSIKDLSPDQLLNFAIGVAKAMKHISDCGIIHRDLAARNVLVGRGFTPKVSDFGMSREQDVYVQASKRRVPTRWLSIESMTKKMYSTKSDVWSFGILLWEIATFGGTPYSNMETRDLPYQLTDGYRMPKPENCEDDMYELMMQCWQEDPDSRPTFKDIVNILTEMEAQDKIYMSTRFYENYKYAAISLDKDDK